MANKKIISVIQARTGSSRLPGKVLLSICGKPLLLRMTERVQRANLAGTVIVATSTDSGDDAIEELCVREGIECFRGNPTDLLDRHYGAAVKYNADIIAKIPSDCPLIDPRIIDRVFDFFLKNDFDYVSNLHPATYPDGNDVEIFSFDTLKKAWHCGEKSFEREHTTPYIWERPEQFKIGNVKWETGSDYSTSHRWTIDYEEDYIFIRTVFDELYNFKPDFTLYDILHLLDTKPYIKNINSKFAGRYWYENHLDELNNIIEYKTKHKKND